MSELTLSEVNRKASYIKWCFNEERRRGRGVSRRLLAYAVYAAMGHDAASASYQKIYAFMRLAGLRWIPSKGEWVYTDLWRFWMSIEPLYRPFWRVSGAVHLFMDMLYIDRIPVDLERWMSS